MTNSDTSGSEGNSTLKPARPRPVRWWPAIMILLIAAGVVMWLRFLQDVVNHQDLNIQTAQVGVITLGALLLWCLCFSRLRWGMRFLIVGGVVGMICVTASLFKIRG